MTPTTMDKMAPSPSSAPKTTPIVMIVYDPAFIPNRQYVIQEYLAKHHRVRLGDHLSGWRLDLMRHPKVMHLAVEAALRADMLFICAKGTGNQAALLKPWLDRVASGRNQNQPLTLIWLMDHGRTPLNVEELISAFRKAGIPCRNDYIRPGEPLEDRMAPAGQATDRS